MTEVQNNIAHPEATGEIPDIINILAFLNYDGTIRLFDTELDDIIDS